MCMGGLFYLGKLDSSKKKKKTKEAGVEIGDTYFPTMEALGGGRLVMAVSVKIGSTTCGYCWSHWKTWSPYPRPVGPMITVLLL